MCGIAGFLSASPLAAEPTALVRRMADCLTHRGPDGEGVWADPERGIALSHRRLAIIDLSEAGAQPMVSASGRWVLTYNGEVYNHEALHIELERSGRAPAWRGYSDTEVLLAAIEAWGLRGALKRCIGMFALALWDRDESRLTLVRDRLGIKPLYYGVPTRGPASGTLLFGSELKAFRAYPGFEGQLDRASAALMLRYGVVPAPRSIYEGIYKLPPGHLVSARIANGVVTVDTPEVWWSAREAIDSAHLEPYAGSEDDAVQELDALLRDAVRLRLVSDVPVGAFLSGGIDSSVIATMMQAVADQPVRTFTIGSSDPRYDESGDAERIAAHLGTRHTTLHVTADDVLDSIPAIAAQNDEPFADSAQVPMALISQLARSEVTVALSGDGGDEMFGGYTRHIWAGRLTSIAHRVPAQARFAAASMLDTPSPELWNRMSGVASGVLPGGLRQRSPGDRIHKLASVLRSRDASDLHERALAFWPPGSSPVHGEEGVSNAGYWPRWTHDLHDADAVTSMQFTDLVTYLPDDVLTKVDRASMAYGLETRVPLLDHRLIPFAYSLPMDWKVRGGRGKWILRRVLERYVPVEMFDRPKTGFGLPTDEWLRGPLRPWAESLLNPAALENEGLLDAAMIRRRWDEHLTGRRNWEQSIWAVLMLQVWRSAQ